MAPVSTVEGPGQPEHTVVAIADGEYGSLVSGDGVLDTRVVCDAWGLSSTTVDSLERQLRAAARLAQTLDRANSPASISALIRDFEVAIPAQPQAARYVRESLENSIKEMCTADQASVLVSAFMQSASYKALASSHRFSLKTAQSGNALWVQDHGADGSLDTWQPRPAPSLASSEGNREPTHYQPLLNGIYERYADVLR